jgi:hypothetical protein
MDALSQLETAYSLPSTRTEKLALDFGCGNRKALSLQFRVQILDLIPNGAYG